MHYIIVEALLVVSEEVLKIGVINFTKKSQNPYACQFMLRWQSLIWQWYKDKIGNVVWMDELSVGSFEWSSFKEIHSDGIDCEAGHFVYITGLQVGIK